MIRNYFKIAWRNLWKHKGVTAIQITGLSVALAICLLIALLLQYEHGFDRYHKKVDRVYRLVSEYKGDNGKEYSITTPYPLPAAFRTDFPELAAVAAVNIEDDALIKTPGNDLFKVPLIVFAGPQLGDILDIEMETGNLASALANPNQVIITKTISRKYFGNSNPIGQIIKLNNKKDLQVSGIMKDWPVKSHLQPSLLVSYATFDKSYLGFDLDQWGMNMTGRTYFMTPENFNPAAFESKLAAFVKKHYPADDIAKLTLKIQPLKNFHLDSHYKSSSETPGISKKYLNIFLLIACLILLLALINYVNLSTARGILRNKEIGVRKAMGAARLQVAGQLLAESTVLTLLSGVIAVGITAVVIPLFNTQFDKSLSFAVSAVFIALYAGGLLVISLLAGFYPAFIISGQKPLLLAKTKSFGSGKNRQWVRQSLVAIQFACAIAFIFGTLIIAMQVNYIRNKDQGYRTDHMLNISLPEPKHIDMLRQEWSQLAGIDHISFGIGAPASDNSFGTSLRPNKNDDNNRISIEAKLADAEYLDTYGLELISGRLLTREDEKYAAMDMPKEQRRYHFLINEKLLGALGFTRPREALGHKYTIGINDIEGEVVGVVKDFHYESLHEQIKPLLLMNFSYFYYSAGIHITASNPQPIIAALETSYKKYFPDSLFEYEFMDETVNKFYKADQLAFSILLFFSVLALVLACLGLVGLSVFVIQRRVKEIGIRKVLGASVGGVVQLLSWEFLKPVLFACLLAFPVAWWAMDKWLDNFAYRIAIPWWILVITGCIALLIALLTVGLQSLKAAIANPVNSLRTE